MAIFKRWVIEVMMLALVALPLHGAGQEAPVSRVNISVDKKGYRFTTSQFTVKAGATVQVVLSVPQGSAVPGANFVILKPGSEGRFARLLRTMPDPKTNKNQYTPSSPDILTMTRWVTPGSLTRLTMKVPKSPGSYVYLCTWPRGTSGAMKGVMRVVK